MEISDLKDSGGNVVVKVGNIVRWSIGDAAPRDVHIEDHLVGSQPPCLVRTLQANEVKDRLKDAAIVDLAGFLRSDESLSVIRPDQIMSLSFEAQGKGGLTAKVVFCHSAITYSYNVTDLAWRALGRQMLRDAGAIGIKFPASRFQHHTGLTFEYLAIGRGQRLDGSYWPFVISVFTSPANAQPIDYART